MQTNIYDFLINDVDPLLIEINSLEKGQSIIVANHEVLLNNFNLYEISSCDMHEVYSTKEKCYRKLSEIVNKSISDEC